MPMPVLSILFIASHWGVDVEVLIGTFGIEAGFISPHSFRSASPHM